MEPAQPSRTEAPTKHSSPDHPPLNGAEPAQRTLPSSSTLNTSTTDPEMPIFSHVPTRPRLSQLAEAGSSTTSIAVEVDTNQRDVLADLDAYVFRRSTAEVAITERRRQRLALRLRQHLLKRPKKEETGGAAKERERRDQIRTEHRAGKIRERRFQASSTDALADDLSTLCTNERDRTGREESTQRIERQNRENQDRHSGRAQ